MGSFLLKYLEVPFLLLKKRSMLALLSPFACPAGMKRIAESVPKVKNGFYNFRSYVHRGDNDKTVKSKGEK